jgi:hypothetical protein
MAIGYLKHAHWSTYLAPSIHPAALFYLYRDFPVTLGFIITVL